jgi:hypothetical protein
LEAISGASAILDFRMLDYARRTCPACGRVIREDQRTCDFCDGTIVIETQDSPPEIEEDGDWPDGKPQVGVRIGRIAVVLAVVVLLAMFEKTRLFLVFVAILQPADLVFILCSCLAGLLCRIRILSVEIGTGPRLVVFRTRSCFAILNSIPLTNSIKWKEETAEQEQKLRPTWRDIPASRSPHDIPFSHRHPLVRLVVYLSGPTGIMLLSILLIGTSATGSFSRAFEQWAGLLFRSHAENVALVHPFLTRLAAGDYAYAIGTLAAKQTAMCLLPFETTVGGLALKAIWEWLSGRRMNRKLELVYRYLSLFIPVIYFCMIAWTIVDAIAHLNP